MQPFRSPVWDQAKFIGIGEMQKTFGEGNLARSNQQVGTYGATGRKKKSGLGITSRKVDIDATQQREEETFAELLKKIAQREA